MFFDRFKILFRFVKRKKKRENGFFKYIIMIYLNRFFYVFKFWIIFDFFIIKVKSIVVLFNFNMGSFNV